MRFHLAILMALLFSAGMPVWAEEAPAPASEDVIATAVDAPVDAEAIPAPAPAPDEAPAPAREDDGLGSLIGDAVGTIAAALTGGTDGTAEGGEEVATWRKVLATIILVAGALLTKWFRRSSLTKARAYEEQARNAGQDTKQRIVARAKAYIWRRAAEIQEYELPDLAAAVVRKQISGEALKARLHTLGDRLVNDTVSYFERQDIDILAEFGREQIASWIRSAVDEISVFKKWPTAKVLVEGGAEAIMAVGMNYAGDYYEKMREKVVKGEAGGSGVLASGTAEAAVVKKIEAAVKKDFENAGAPVAAGA